MNAPETSSATPELVRAPWTAKQVASLNAFQDSGAFHPFTCGNYHCPGRYAPYRPSLVAREDGWHCSACDYTQNWAHAFMAEWPTPGAEAAGQAAYETWRAAVPEWVCNVPAGPWGELSPAVRAGFNAIAAAPAAPQPAPVTVKSLAAAFTGRQILVDVDQAERSDTGDGMWLVMPARPHDLAVQLLGAIDKRLTDDPVPELGVVPDSEATDMRAVIDMIWRMCQKPEQVVGERLADRIAGLIKNSGMEPF